MTREVLQIKRIDKSLPLPMYQTNGAGGIDLHAAESFQVYDDYSFSFGIAVKIPNGYVGIVTTRSGIGFKLGVESRLGVIDSDYRGEVKGKLYNFTPNTAYFKKGDRVAQLLIIPYCQLPVEEVNELDDTVRGDGGFGSTGGVSLNG